MSKKAIAFVLASSAVAVIAVTGPATAGESPEWTLEGCVDAAGRPTTKITSDTVCELKNTKKNACLIRESHMGQADWDFAPCSKHPKSARFHTESGGALNYGEHFALQLGVGGSKQEWYRKCHNPQTVGINICSDEGSPEKKHYEWQFKGGSGQVEAGKALTLFNTARNDSVVYAKRPSKMVDTCWHDKMRYGQCASARDE